ncbi:hypothetical protein FAI41_04765 [Acetobacteraceae bacterium]|nr:hypothetical protein FAI41_04765 [Acetobacteraceae bacterium]
MTQAILNDKGFAITAGTLTTYSYHPETGEYLGETNPFISLGTGVPADCTLTAPEVAETGFVYCWDGKEWQKTENHRGETVYSEKDGSPFEMKQLGALPDDYTKIKPPLLSAGETLDGFDPENQKWIIHPPSALFQAKANYQKYTAAYFEGLPIDNLPPDQVIAKAKSLAAWIKQAEENGEK